MTSDEFHCGETTATKEIGSAADAFPSGDRAVKASDRQSWPAIGNQPIAQFQRDPLLFAFWCG